MYNGIGLNTPRGTGTNGYVQSNVAHVKEWKVKTPDGYREILDIPAPKIKDANKEILSHEKKRKIEVEVYKYRLELEEKNIPEEEIEKQIEKKRSVLLGRLEIEEMDKSIKRPNYFLNEKEKREEKKQFFNKTNKESHSFKEAQLKKNERAKNILKISKDFQPGDGFDFDGERRKQRQREKQEEEEKLEFIKQIEMNKKKLNEIKEKKQEIKEKKRKDSSDEDKEEEDKRRNSSNNDKTIRRNSRSRSGERDDRRGERGRRDYSPNDDRRRRESNNRNDDRRGEERERRREYSPNEERRNRRRHYSSDSDSDSERRKRNYKK